MPQHKMGGTYRKGVDRDSPLLRRATPDGYYTAEETEAIAMMAEYKRVNNKRFPDVTDMLFVLKVLGWTMDNAGKYKCSCCGEWKDRSKFANDSRIKRGHRSDCRKCVKDKYYKKG